MHRGELYRIHKPGGDPKSYRQIVLDSRFSTALCAPVFIAREGLSTQVPVGPDEGLKHHSWIMCDNLVSIRKSDLTNYVARLSPAKTAELHCTLKMALEFD